MFQSFIIVGGTEEERVNKALNSFISDLDPETKSNIASSKKSNHADISIIIPENSIGIEEVRNLEKNIFLKPHQLPQKAFIIDGADKLTIEAQNALLKTLEEPPPHVIIFLLSENDNYFLPTIISRCRIISLPNKKNRLTSEELDYQKKTTDSLLEMDISERLLISKEIASGRENSIKWLNNNIIYWKQILTMIAKEKPPQDKPIFKLTLKIIISIIRRAIRTRDIVEKNINSRLAIDNYLLDLPKIIV